ncbi:hypothetical protein F2Q69_00003968 [Brassica cretica]|uniref:Protein kinase domain-containing protein n=1 Tax=Brassica cretica TaxID=69181 RepID=A0A8S9P0Y0_BRACR|nr:hypothetical protein F2Q69_00003968 [Brassica cretica]
MKTLLVIKLSANNLNRSIPQDLLKKKGLKLISDGNPDLICADELCANKSVGSKKKSSVVPIVVSVVVVVVLGSALAFFFVFRKKKTPNSADPRTTRSSVPAIMTKNGRFTYSEVVTMTYNFEKILGKGGFGMVYHGTVNGTEQVAVKVLSHSSSQGYKEFKAEAKLADFGLSRSFPVEGETHVSTVVAGTPGYLDPEYYRTNWLNEKSDVYSFGIVLLEIITNQPVINQNREKPYIAEWVGVMLTEGDIQNIVDPKLHGDYDSGSVWRAVELAMSCLNPSSARRPTMSEVVTELNECFFFFLEHNFHSSNFLRYKHKRELSILLDQKHKLQ